MKNTSQLQSIALKEWAVAVDALLGGRQTLIMRKGGIAEETRDFQVQSDSFFFLPAYEHQRKELLKPEEQAGMDRTMADWRSGQSHVAISGCARVEADWSVSEEEELARLMPYHIWTGQFAEERLHWKRRNPLHVLILRVYRLEQPAQIPVLPSYSGCRSWIGLEADLSGIALSPVVPDDEFYRTVEEIGKALGR